LFRWTWCEPTFSGLAASIWQNCIDQRRRKQYSPLAARDEVAKLTSVKNDCYENWEIIEND
jgi:hypothetical protein